MAGAIVSRPFTNGAYGFPDRRDVRRIAPVVLGVCHITGNSRTAAADATTAGLGTRGEYNYANRAGSTGPSAHAYVDRHGNAILALNWRRFAAWSNGDLIRPDTTNLGVRRLLALVARGYNANEGCGVEAELSGYGTAYPVNTPQIDLFARLVAEAADEWQAEFRKLTGATGAAVIRRDTVLGHFHINSVNRSNCPCPPGRHDAVMDLIVERARAWYVRLFAPAPAPVPVPPPPAEEYPVIEVTDRAAHLIVIRQGATILDLNGKPLVEVTNVAERLSPGATPAGRLVYTYFAGSTKLGVARSTDLVSSTPVAADCTAEVERERAAAKGAANAAYDEGLGVAGAAIATLPRRAAG